MKIAAISRLNCPHHMDHLMPLVDLLGAKFVTCEENHFDLAKGLYPPHNIELIEMDELGTEFVKDNYDVIIHSFSWPKKLIDYDLFGKKRENKLRAIHTPHGNSDKGYYSGIVRNYAFQDICLIYGDHMLDMLKTLEVDLKDYVIIGNIRYAYYQKHKAFFDQTAHEKIFQHFDPQKKTIIYAPTWDDFENSTSVYEAHTFVLDHLPKEYNVLVKLHPWLGHESIGRVYHMIGKYENNPGIQFLTEFPPIYPLLAKSDIYLGDLSSIGYDFLAFDRPMFFFDNNRPKEDKSLFLHQCGITIPLLEGHNILKIINENLAQTHLSAKRREIYQYAFGNMKNPEILKKEILAKI